MRGRDMVIIMMAVPAVMGQGYGYKPAPAPTCDKFHWTREATTQDPTWTVYVQPKQEGYGQSSYGYEAKAITGDILGLWRLESTYPEHLVLFERYGKGGDVTTTRESAGRSFYQGTWKKSGCNTFDLRVDNMIYSDTKPFLPIGTQEVFATNTIHYDGSLTSREVVIERDLYGKIISKVESELRGTRVPEVVKETY
eukprot:GHVN01081684.1.p1 GENE.GHVN01081684.1~~GHVN01081684.1.p1  ORF type:complete len:196 (-),score=9.10 GHVN01081684.1:50-637(-)